MKEKKQKTKHEPIICRIRMQL